MLHHHHHKSGRSHVHCCLKLLLFQICSLVSLCSSAVNHIQSYYICFQTLQEQLSISCPTHFFFVVFQDYIINCSVFCYSDWNLTLPTLSIHFLFFLKASTLPPCYSSDFTHVGLLHNASYAAFHQTLPEAYSLKQPLLIYWALL